MKPHLHAESSARRWGGTAADYIEIHEFLDSSKAAIADNRHRALTHNSWFIATVMPRVFGRTLTNADGRTVSVRDVCEMHVLEDYGKRFIPAASDFLVDIEFRPWMQNGEQGHKPPSAAKLPRDKHEQPRVSGGEGTHLLETRRVEEGCE